MDGVKVHSYRVNVRTELRYTVTSKGLDRVKVHSYGVNVRTE